MRARINKTKSAVLLKKCNGAHRTTRLATVIKITKKGNVPDAAPRLSRQAIKLKNNSALPNIFALPVLMVTHCCNDDRGSNIARCEVL